MKILSSLFSVLCLAFNASALQFSVNMTIDSSGFASLPVGSGVTATLNTTAAINAPGQYNGLIPPIQFGAELSGALSLVSSPLFSETLTITDGATDVLSFSGQTGASGFGGFPGEVFFSFSLSDSTGSAITYNQNGLSINEALFSSGTLQISKFRGPPSFETVRAHGVLASVPDSGSTALLALGSFGLLCVFQWMQSSRKERRLALH